MKEYFYIMLDDYVKSPTSVLRCILRHYDVLSVRLIPQDLRALNLELFTLPSSLDFLRDHQSWAPESLSLWTADWVSRDCRDLQSHIDFLGRVHVIFVL